MNRFPILLLLLLLSSLTGMSAHAAEPSDASERRDLLASRKAIDVRFARESQACQQQFQVNACMDGIRAKRAAELRPIQARELVLDAAARKARSEAQTQRVAERQREFAAEEGRRRTEALQNQGASPSRSSNPLGTLPGSGSTPHAPPVDPEVHARDITRQQQEAAAAAAQDRDQLNRRQRLVLQHQQDVQQRQEARDAAARKPVGKPLPIPSAAEIAAAAAAASASKR